VYGFLGGWGYKGWGWVGLFSVKEWGVPFLQPGRKKTLGIRVICGTLGVQKSQKSLKRAFWVHFKQFKAVFTYFERFFAIFEIFCRFWLIFYLKGDFLERVGGGTTFLAERVGGVPKFWPTTHYGLKEADNQDYANLYCHHRFSIMSKAVAPKPEYIWDRCNNYCLSFSSLLSNFVTLLESAAAQQTTLPRGKKRKVGKGKLLMLSAADRN
jgi:hypothetical protein